MSSHLYLLDANIFITAARGFYSFDFGYNFWNFLVQKAKNNEVASIDKVFDEIKNGDDELKSWAKTHFSDYFFDTKSSDEILENYAKLMNWVENKKGKYKQDAIDMFIKPNNADAWLIACAMTDKEKFIVVTFEKKDDNTRSRIKIPNVCEEFGIKYCDLYKMLKNLNFKFNF
jgi:hypothetical protein